MGNFTEFPSRGIFEERARIPKPLPRFSGRPGSDPSGRCFCLFDDWPLRYGPLEVLEILSEKLRSGWEVSDRMASGMIWQVRLPRIMASAMIGAGLSVSGAVFQGLFKNPLASPYTLGVQMFRHDYCFF